MLRADIPDSGIYQMTGAAADLHGNQAVVQSTLPVGPYYPEDAMVLEILVVGKGAMWSLQEDPEKKNHSAGRPRGSKAGMCHL